MMTTLNGLIEILMIEDNPGDVRLAQEAFKEARVLNEMHVVSDGIEALSYLRREGQYIGQSQPDLILLDINLPKKSGHEVLKEIKENPLLKRIPIVVLTTSKAEEDIVKTYNNHANCFITKSVDFEQFLNVIKKIGEFWLTIVKLPPH